MALQPSRVGKNNLYKAFVARAVELLAEGGYLSFIVPMPLLGDKQARGIRRMLLSAGEFSETHAFPQKDNVARRVFRDAKQSTALFVYRKLRPDLRTEGRFKSHVHPAQFIEPNSPSLTLNSNSITLYDPENLTIVSCSQQDWDLAARILQRPGIARLGRFCRILSGRSERDNCRPTTRCAPHFARTWSKARSAGIECLPLCSTRRIARRSDLH